MKPFNAAQTFLLNQPKARILINRAAGLFAFSVVMVSLIEAFTPASSQATLPVLDYAAVSQMLVQTAQFTQHLTMMAEQIAQLKAQVQSLTGHYGLGSLGGPVNGWGGSSWNDIANMVNTGVNPGDAAQVLAYKTARTQVVSRYPALDPSLQTTNPRMNAVYGGTYQATITGMSAGEGTFNTLNTLLIELQTLKNKIEQTSTVKAAIDLNNAIAVQNAEINAELLRPQAVGLYVQSNAQNAVTSGQAAQTEFFAN